MRQDRDLQGQTITTMACVWWMEKRSVCGRMWKDVMIQLSLVTEGCAGLERLKERICLVMIFLFVWLKGVCVEGCYDSAFSCYGRMGKALRKDLSCINIINFVLLKEVCWRMSWFSSSCYGRMCRMGKGRRKDASRWSDIPVPCVCWKVWRDVLIHSLSSLSISLWKDIWKGKGFKGGCLDAAISVSLKGMPHEDGDGGGEWVMGCLDE